MELALALILGLVIGSFLNVCIARIPHRLSISFPGSHCPNCKKPIAFYDNVPLFSYLILGGRCRLCKTKISLQYPIIEAATGLVSVALYLRFGFSIEWGIFFAFSCALIVLALIDIMHRILPDLITLNGIWLGILSSIVLARPSGFVSKVTQWAGLSIADPRILATIASVFGMIIGGGLLWLVGEAYFRFRGVEGMGFGDVKMMAMVGAFLGAPLTLLTIMMGSVLGSVVGLTMIRFGGKTRNYELPFGTFLSIAGILAVLYGDAMLRFYINSVIRPGL